MPPSPACPPRCGAPDQLRSGPTAQRLLDEAVAQGNAATLENIYRLYFYTDAGYQAAYLLGEALLAEGQPLSAARCFARLRASPGARRFEPMLSVKLAASYYLADDRQQTLEALETLRKDFPRLMLRVGGRDLPGPGPGEQALTWLAAQIGDRQPGGPGRGEQWLVHRGNAARNATSQGDEPVALRWQARTSDNPQLLDERLGVVPYLMRRSEQRGQLALPSTQGLVVRRPRGAARIGRPGTRRDALDSTGWWSSTWRPESACSRPTSRSRRFSSTPPRSAPIRLAAPRW